MKKTAIVLLILLIAGCTQLESFLGEEKKVRLRIKWIGQAGFMIENDKTRIYIDPYSMSVDSLKGDIILVTHADFDHCDPASISRLLKHDGIVLATADCGVKLNVNNLVIVEPEKNYTVKGINITTVHAYSLTDPQHTKGTGVGYIINISGFRIFHAGDTELTPELAEIRDIDIAILPVSNEEYSMNKEDAAVAARLINATYTIPMQHPNIQTARAFKDSLPDMNVEILSNKDLVFYENT